MSNVPDFSVLTVVVELDGHGHFAHHLQQVFGAELELVVPGVDAKPLPCRPNDGPEHAVLVREEFFHVPALPCSNNNKILI